MTSQNKNSLKEFALIHQIKDLFSKNIPPTIKGIGDDCAVIPQNENQTLLVTTDLLTENIHFIRKEIDPSDLGYKSLAVSVSDIAAMGGTPRFAFLSMALPANIETEWTDRFLIGFHQLCLSEGILLLGGDTTGSMSGITTNVTLLGEMDPRLVKMRSGAKPGAVVCVTGPLGDSAAGLKIVLEKLPRTPDREILIQRHFRPRPHTAEGQWLAQFPSVQAMIDLSDGLRSDLRRIMEESACGFEIQIENLPSSPEVETVSQELGFDPLPLMTSGGEDYCLLVAIDSSEEKRIREKFQAQFRRPLYPIGKVTGEKQNLIFIKNGKEGEIPDLTYQHLLK